MKSTAKGNLFEDRVYKELENLLLNDKLFVSSKSSRIYQRKKYYSADRQGDIVVDISIECCREGSEIPNFYILIECKDYQKPIPINELEEFYAKKEQIARANSKCLFITTNSLQSSSFNYATAKGIGVVRMFDDDSLQWLVERSDKELTTSKKNSDAINVFNAITSEFYISTFHKAYIYSDSKTYFNILDLIFDLIKSNYDN